jgi:hypothetical protein
MSKIAFLLAIFLASSSLVDTALASHNGREECILICLNAYNGQMQAKACKDGLMWCKSAASEQNVECRKACSAWRIVHG